MFLLCLIVCAFLSFIKNSRAEETIEWNVMQNESHIAPECLPKNGRDGDGEEREKKEKRRKIRYDTHY